MMSIDTFSNLVRRIMFARRWFMWIAVFGCTLIFLVVVCILYKDVVSLPKKQDASVPPHIRAEVLGDVAPGDIYTTMGDLHVMDPSYPKTQPYTVKLDKTGKVLWWRAENADTLGFKKLDDEQYTLTHFTNTTGRWDGFYTILDDAYNVIRTIRFQGNEDTDIHGLDFLKNGNVIVPSYQLETVDGKKVENFVIQELTPDNRVVFTWKSLDYVPLSATHVIETRPYWIANHIVDYFHGNSVFETPDGDLLISGRNVSQVLLIDRHTGAVKWRLGGTGSDFTFVNDPLGGFSMQHSVSMLSNGDILLYDNGNEHTPPQTRVAEYKLDMQHKTASLVWSYEIPSKFTYAGGSVQRLSDGHTFIGWGFDTNFFSTSVRMTELDASNTPVLNIYYPEGSALYNAFKQN